MGGHWSDWTTLTGLQMSAGKLSGIDPRLSDKYTRRANLAVPGTLVSRAFWRVYQGYGAWLAGQQPWDDTDARECAQHHGMEGDHSSQFGWLPGAACSAVVGDANPGGGGGGGGPLTGDGWVVAAFAVGSQVYQNPEFLYLTGSNFECDVHHSYGAFSRTGYTNIPPIEIITQIPGLPAAAAASDRDDDTTWPVVEAIRCDGHLRAQVIDTQTRQTQSTSVNVHLGKPAARDSVTPYSALPGAVTSCGGTPGSVSGVIDFPDVPLGGSGYVTLSSSRLASNPDPTATDSSVVDGVIAVDSTWSVRWRYWIPTPATRKTQPPLRWLQRNDGLGLSGVPRFQQVSSQQASVRQSSAYR